MPFYLESYEQSPALGRIAIMESNSLCMLGKVIQTQT
jgi:translation elongation factor EF-1alpha